ncbi:MAG: PEP/pyruvate-binding domain-containing protein [Kiritimatiellae bacterium]|nr:PEP/pyruvate-binding domain-containing protein [Kiritimatiellia bacterium]MDD5519433.1 PEP/pyruvate-binding domain-containing protein [Kiritimatiellia bacterium]
MTTDLKPTTGLPGLDSILKGILPGDNIVWQVSAVEDYMAFALPYCESARKAGHKLIYFRFASHKPILPPDFGTEVHELIPEKGFENFIAGIHSVIEKAGQGAYYVFDCLSELAVDWYSDQMLGNFFMLTCPYLFDLQTIAYFGLLRNYHSTHATGPISETTQLFLDVYHHKKTLYVQPLKVQHRYSPTMNMLYVRNGSDFTPVTTSAVISEILTSSHWSGLEETQTASGSWERAFIRAEEFLSSNDSKRYPLEKQWELFRQLARMIVSRDTGMLKVISKYMNLEDILEIRKRIIGSGLIGGKTVGMLLARKILKQSDSHFAKIMEQHDSFYIGSDVFYTFLVRNGIWWVRQKQRNPATFLEGAEQARQRILTGKFPDYIVKQFEGMLDYFGQSPIIVRSSSLLEDNFGNSFAGKYESVFCANQGPKERRLEDFMAAVRSVYSSSMSKEALKYRARHGILDKDEQMALLVMRVSGSMYGNLFYPQIAGVGFSFNPFVWNQDIDPHAGVVRLVFGLGTRAVNRSDDDYTRIVALNAPSKRPEANREEICQYSQHRVDYLDLEANQLVSGDFRDVAVASPQLPIEKFATLMNSDREGSDAGRKNRQTVRKPWVLTFDTLLAETDFIKDMRKILKILSEAYNNPVDTEFAANFMEDGNYKINLLQCRPLQVQGTTAIKLPEINVEQKDSIIIAHGAVVGQSRLINIDRFIYVVPQKYGILSISDRHVVAQTIGQINHALGEKKENLMLIGPGRWGTSTPSLGIPVSFSDINHVSILCELVMMRDDLIPDVSLGTHFLNELVEMNMLYLALFPNEKSGDGLNRKFFENEKDHLLEIVPQAGKWQDVIRIINSPALGASGPTIKLAANAFTQEVKCYFER